MSECKKKILIISAWLPGGGVETVISNFSRIFFSRGYQVKVVCLSSFIEWKWFENKEFDITFHSIYQFEKDLNILFSLKNYRKIISILRKEINAYPNSNILITHTFLGLFVNRLYKILGVNFFFFPMNPLFKQLQNNTIKNYLYCKIKRIYVNILIKNFNSTICISSQIQNQLAFLPNIPSYLTFVPINLNENLNLNKIPKIPHYLFIGRLDKRKNLTFLLKSLSQLKSKNWKLDIVGEGPEKEIAYKLSIDLKIQENLNWIGLRFPPFGNTLDYTSLFMTSLSEGFPIVVIDALSFGIPVICSNNLSIYEDAIIEGFNGFRYLNNSNESLCDTIEKINSDNLTFISQEISKQCVNKFNDDQYYKRLCEILK